MKHFINVSLLTILTLLLTSLSFFAQEQSSKPNASDKTKDGMVYQCPVDRGVISNVPGRCSKCDSKLVELTMDEAMENLSGAGRKKPELKIKTMNMGKNEKNETEEISPADTLGNLEEEGSEELDKESEHEHGEENTVNVFKIDVNGDGKVYQCTMCPDQLSDESDECGKCGMELRKLTTQEAHKNLMRSGN